MDGTVFRTIDAGFAWLEAFTNLESIRASKDRQMYRLDRMEYLLGRFDNPHLACRSVHVAGSKGKGSTSALIASALTEWGQRTGLYTSPHVSSYAERIAVDGEPAAPEILLRWMNAIRTVVDAIPAGTLPVSPSPTTFELLTLLGFLVFRDLGCAWAVVEVGIGGRLDATNVVRPEVSVITPIELEHTDILGDTLEEIAREKGGIIKSGVPAVSAAQRPVVRRELELIAAARGTSIAFVDELDRIEELRVRPGGTSFTLQRRSGRLDVELVLPGRFQASNAALALEALSLLRPAPDEATVLRGFARTALPGRMELLRAPGGQEVVLDGAHTPVSVRGVAESFLEMYPGGGVLVFGSVAGKRTDEMAQILAPLFRSIVISRPNPFKESSPEEVFQAFSRHGGHCVLEKDPGRALEAALAAGGGKKPVLVTGSFYMISEVRRHLIP